MERAEPARLTHGGAPIPALTGWLARLWSGGFRRVLDRIDAGLVTGRIDATLPDGSRRTLGGRAPGFVADVTLHDWRALLRLAAGGSIGWYQAWEAGEWSSPDPVPLFALFMANGSSLGTVARAGGPWRWAARLLHRRNRNTRARAAQNIHAHYDLGNDFYEAWLDESMIYSSGMFPEPNAPAVPSKLTQFVSELSQAQSRKVGALLERIEPGEGERVLEIGAGWGTLAAMLADQFAADVVAISLSDEQLAWAREQWGQPAQGRVEFRKQDYRDVAEPFDAIVSVEMVEAVGREYWGEFMDCIARCLRPGGRAAIQYIAMRDDLFDAYAASADFIQAYVFPGGMLIRESEFRALAEARGLVWEDPVWFGQDYAETLRLWRSNFDRAVAENRLPPQFDERFVRLWRYYLMYCEGGFRGGGIDVSQVTLIKAG